MSEQGTTKDLSISAVEEDGDEVFTPIPAQCHCGGEVAPHDGFHKCGKCGGSYGPVEGGL